MHVAYMTISGTRDTKKVTFAVDEHAMQNHGPAPPRL
jgi:hypothetical protein